ncbi:MAG: GNAT family N-acetyltransferase [Clostridia bacterium]|nr:GNAT family N-acetyltransferase [Clostridia bacterium]
MRFSEVESNKEKYMALLVDADPSEAMVRTYLEEGTMIRLEDEGETACLAIVKKVGPDTLELMNLVTVPEKRRRGYAAAMMRYLNTRFAPHFTYLTVGTAATRVAFYKKQGFMVTHTVPDFFPAHYPEPVMDRGVLCVEKIYLRKVLHNSGLVRMVPRVLQKGGAK